MHCDICCTATGRIEWGSMLSVVRVHLPSDIPVLGCELTPYVLLCRPDGSSSPADIPETDPVEGCFLTYRWYRIQSAKKVAVCSMHPAEPAALQCLGCVKANIPVNKSYHCSPKCFADSWRNHRSMHACAADENGIEEEVLFGCFSSTGSSVIATGNSLGLPPSDGLVASHIGLNDGSIFSGFAPISERNGDEIWYEVGRNRTYTPTTDDVGHALKLQCTAVEASTGKAIGLASTCTLLTSPVILVPSPIPRGMVSTSTLDGMAALELGSCTAGSGTFTVLSYNVLADIYATSDKYSYCPPWALSWAYRRQNLLREIVGYQADILCLQEVQSDHFDDFFATKLEKYGYMAVYKKKTVEVTRHSILRCDNIAKLP